LEFALNLVSVSLLKLNIKGFNQQSLEFNEKFLEDFVVPYQFKLDFYNMELIFHKIK